jgi:hypothetical protein
LVGAFGDVGEKRLGDPRCAFSDTKFVWCPYDLFDVVFPFTIRMLCVFGSMQLRDARVQEARGGGSLFTRNTGHVGFGGWADRQFRVRLLGIHES